MLIKPISFLRAESGGGTLVAPGVRSISANYNSTGANTLALGAHAANDIIFVGAVNRGHEGPIATPAGYTALAGNPFFSGSGNTSADVKFACFWKRATSAAEPGIAISDGSGSAQRTIAKAIVIQGCKTTGTPFVEFAGNSGNNAAPSAPGGATGGDARLLLSMFGLIGVDRSTSNLSAGFANGDLTGMTNEFQYNSNSNSGYGIYAATGERNVAGTVGATTGTWSTAGDWAGVQIALIPEGG